MSHPKQPAVQLTSEEPPQEVDIETWLTECSTGPDPSITPEMAARAIGIWRNCRALIPDLFQPSAWTGEDGQVDMAWRAAGLGVSVECRPDGRDEWDMVSRGRGGHEATVAAGSPPPDDILKHLHRIANVQWESTRGDAESFEAAISRLSTGDQPHITEITASRARECMKACREAVPGCPVPAIAESARGWVALSWRTTTADIQVLIGSSGGDSWMVLPHRPGKGVEFGDWSMPSGEAPPRNVVKLLRTLAAPPSPPKRSAVLLVGGPLVPDPERYTLLTVPVGAVSYTPEDANGQPYPGAYVPGEPAEDGTPVWVWRAQAP